jgi:hypothetical protein
MQEQTRFKLKLLLRNTVLLFAVFMLILVFAPVELLLILVVTFLLLFSIWKKSRMSIAFLSVFLAFSIYLEINRSSSEEIFRNTWEKDNSQCVNVLGGYLEDISTGLIDSSYSLESGYSAYLGSKEIKEIQLISPSYTNPQIVSAKIKGPDITSNTIVGTWAIQDFIGFKRIIPLNINASKYSFSETSDVKESVTGRLIDTLDKFSQSTNTFRCSFQDEENN